MADENGLDRKGTATTIGKAVKGAAAGAANAAKGVMKKGWEDYPEESGGKAGQVLYGCGDGVSEEAPYYNRLRGDLANSYYWTGGFWKDYFFFVANWHPLIGMLACHPNHPWTKASRLAMFLISLSITMVPSAAIGASYPEKGQMFTLRTPMIIAFVTIPDIIIGVILYQLSIAGSRCPNTCGCCWEMIKKCFFVYVIIIALASAGISYVILDSSDTNWNALFVPLIEGRMYSFVTWFPMWLVLPCQLGFIDLWCFERWMSRRGEKKESGEANANGQQGAVDGIPL